MHNRQANNDNQTSMTEKAPETKNAMNKKCPICGKTTLFEYRPFCSKRCADVDLAKWLDGKYFVAGGGDSEEDGSLPFSDNNLEKKIEESE